MILEELGWLQVQGAEQGSARLLANPAAAIRFGSSQMHKLAYSESQEGEFDNATGTSVMEVSTSISAGACACLQRRVGQSNTQQRYS